MNYKGEGICIQELFLYFIFTILCTIEHHLSKFELTEHASYLKLYYLFFFFLTSLTWAFLILNINVSENLKEYQFLNDDEITCTHTHTYIQKQRQ